MLLIIYLCDSVLINETSAHAYGAGALHCLQRTLYRTLTRPIYVNFIYGEAIHRSNVCIRYSAMMRKCDDLIRENFSLQSRSQGKLPLIMLFLTCSLREAAKKLFS